MHPIVYEVDLFVDEEIAADFEAWLHGHRMDMLAIDGFLDAAIYAREVLDEDEESGQRRMTVQYTVRDREALDRYVEREAPRLREDGRRRFGERFSARRSVLRSAATAEGKVESYRRLAKELEALLEGESDFLANMANTTGLLGERLPGLNWVGFYLRRGDQLVLGPFQGRSACVRIDWGHGVCGSSAAERRSLAVPDVHAFAGHIACDARSRSEAVVPMIAGDELLGVLDLDSPLVGRFDDDDLHGLEDIVAILLHASELPATQESR